MITTRTTNTTVFLLPITDRITRMLGIDSAGLETLLWTRDYCDENNSQLRLAGLDENCSKILEITRLDKEFDSYAELAEAVKSFA